MKRNTQVGLGRDCFVWQFVRRVESEHKMTTAFSYC